MNKTLKPLMMDIEMDYASHNVLLEEAHLHDKFEFKACVMNPDFYKDLMNDNMIKSYVSLLQPMTELRLFHIPIKISREVDTISWLIDLK